MGSVPDPQIEESRAVHFLTSIWIVPLIALIVSAALVYRHFSNLG
jgi:paraquat-inducible protein B